MTGTRRALTAELIDHFLDRQTKRDLDAAVDNTAKRILLDAGVRRAGQKIRVNRGRHAGYVGEIEAISWTEAEVRCRGNPRWFSLWHDPGTFTVLRPSSAPPPRGARLQRLDRGGPGPSSGVPGAVPVPSTVAAEIGR